MDADRLIWALVGLLWIGTAALLRRSHAVATLCSLVGLTWLAPAVLSTAVLWHRGPLIHLLLAAGAWWPRSRTAQVVVVSGYALSASPVAWPHLEVAVVAGAAIMTAAAMERSARPVSPAGRASWQVATSVTALAFVVPSALAWGGLSPQWSAPVLLAYSLSLAVVALLVIAAVRPWSSPWVTDLAVDLGPESATDLWAELVPRLADPALVRAEVEQAMRAAARLRTRLDERQAELRHALRETQASRKRLASSDEAARLRLASEIESLTAERLTHAITEVEHVTTSTTGEAARNAHRAGMHLVRAREELDALGRGLVRASLAEGLPPALSRLASASSVPVDLVAPEDSLADLPTHTATTAYFVAAEALTNAVKHAQAHRIGITAARRDGHLELRVADDGVGGARADGLGLSGVRDRVLEAGGSLDLTSPPGGGTEIRVVLPVRQEHGS